MESALFSAPPRRMSLSQLCGEIAGAVSSAPALRGVWVTAELSNVGFHGPHCYMKLIEKDATGRTLAQLDAAIWGSSLPGLRRKFAAATGSDIRTGIKVLVFCSVSYHSVYGIKATISDIDPSYTLGDMERIRREILERLQREEIIGANKLRQLPAAPQRIAVISGAGAAGYGDFLKQLEENPGGFIFYTHLFPAAVQGQNTSRDVRRALQAIAGRAELFDCVVIIRGGGASIDLNGFDDYELARAVALFPLPVIVGIGHERDRTVLDEIACVRCKTPTAVGAFLIERLSDAMKRAADAATFICRQATERLRREDRELSRLSSAIPSLALGRLSAATATLASITRAIPAFASGIIGRQAAMLDAMPRRIEDLCSARTAFAARVLSDTASQAARAASLLLTSSAERLRSMESLVGAYSPDATLRRGYSITRAGGKAVTSADMLAPGTTLTTTFHSGTIKSIVTEP